MLHKFRKISEFEGFGKKVKLENSKLIIVLKTEIQKSQKILTSRLKFKIWS